MNQMTDYYEYLYPSINLFMFGPGSIFHSTVERRKEIWHVVRQPSEVMVLVVNRPKSKRFLHLVNKRCGVVVILSLFLLVVGRL